MGQYFISTISYLTPDEKGRTKKITEKALIYAVGYTDAETITYERKVQNFDDWKIVSIRKINLSEVFIDEQKSMTFYKIKVEYIVFDERTAVEKTTPYYFILNAESIKDAYECIIKNLGAINDYEVTEIKKMPIDEVVNLPDIPLKAF